MSTLHWMQRDFHGHKAASPSVCLLHACIVTKRTKVLRHSSTIWKENSSSPKNGWWGTSPLPRPWNHFYVEIDYWCVHMQLWHYLPCKKISASSFLGYRQRLVHIAYHLYFGQNRPTMQRGTLCDSSATCLNYASTAKYTGKRQARLFHMMQYLRTVLSGGISTKLGRNIHRVSEHCWKGF